ncbi:N4-gp56 family major capsid protein [Sphingomonas sp.]|uniref:N4-gp56 family major capsid protein n=1 Tax=Sphingomonas sp. TaxID=28214 RepID=UPI003B3B0A82
MSTTTIPSTSNAAIKVWSRKAFSDAVKATMYGKMTGQSDRSIVQVKSELKKDRGDRITFGLRSLPTGIGVQDDETLEGQEEGLDFRDFALYLGEKRHAIKVDLNLSAQRTMFQVKQEAKDALQEWLEDYLDTTFFEYLSGIGVGAGGVSKYHPRGFLGGNALLAPSSDRIIYAGTGNTARNTLVVTDTMTLSVLDKAAERVKLATPTMRKAQFDGKSLWVVVLHPYQVNDLRSNTSPGQWMDITRAVVQGGKSNPFEGEVVGVYREMLILESSRVPTFANGGAGGNLAGARALFLGAQAAVVAHGNDTDGWGKMQLVERTFDYGKRYGVAVTLIWGMAKTRFNNQSDFGCFVIETCAAQHN